MLQSMWANWLLDLFHPDTHGWTFAPDSYTDVQVLVWGKIQQMGKLYSAAPTES
jgi:hypothetical protein